MENFSFESLEGIRDSASRIEFAEEFLSAHKRSDYERLDARYPRVFGCDAREQNADDIEGVCKLMNRANEIYALAKSRQTPEISDLLACGISPIFSGVGPADSEDIVVDTFHVSFLCKVKGDNYRAWLEGAAGKVDNRFPGAGLAMACDGGYLHDDTGLRPIRERESLSEDCGYVLQQLVTLHLADVATVFDDGLHPAQTAYSGISSLWLGLCERMSGGRAFRCKACGKPSVDYGGRRSKVYCSNACRKWASANPGKTRAHWYYER